MFPPMRGKGLGPIPATLILIVAVCTVLAIIHFRFLIATAIHG